MRHKEVSKKKQELLDAELAHPFRIGDVVAVPENLLNKNTSRTNATTCVVVKVGKTISVKRQDSSVYKDDVFKIAKKDIIKDMTNIGPNHFVNYMDHTRPVAFTMQSILFNLDVLEEGERDSYKIGKYQTQRLNWNPFVYDKDGKKQHYQRDFVWTTEQKQMLIDSIYQQIECGRILVRLRSWEELEKMEAKGETVLAFIDLVDGKQRLGAVRDFIQGKFPDSYGDYFSDLSYIAQWKFTDHQLFSYMEMPENSQDSMVLSQFLRLNFCGVPQSKEHIEYVKSLRGQM